MIEKSLQVSLSFSAGHAGHRADKCSKQSAFKAGLNYPQLIERVIRTGLKTVRE